MYGTPRLPTIEDTMITCPKCHIGFPVPSPNGHGDAADTEGESSPASGADEDDVGRAVKKLADQTNYTWRATVVVPDDAPFTK